MALVQPTQPLAVLVAIDIAKLRHDVLIEAPGWSKRVVLAVLMRGIRVMYPHSGYVGT
jgi:hypothetical protein